MPCQCPEVLIGAGDGATAPGFCVGLPPNFLCWLVRTEADVNCVTLEAVGRPGQIGDNGDEGCARSQRSHIWDGMIRITVTPAAYEAIAATLAFGTVAVEPERARDGGVISGSILASWRSSRSRRGPGQSYSDVIIRVARGRR